MMNNKKRGFKMGAAAFMTAIIVLAIVVVVNVIMIQLDVEWDLTPNKIYTLGDTSKNFLKTVKKDVIIYALFDDAKAGNGEQNKVLKELLDEYKAASPKIKVKYVDPDKQPDIMNQIDPEKTKNMNKNDVIVTCGKKIEVVPAATLTTSQQTQMGTDSSFSAENYITTGLKRATSDKTPTIYYTIGHNERSMVSDYSQIKFFMESGSYNVKELNLKTVAKVPEDCEAMFVFAPQSDLLTDEAMKMSEYIDNGGKMFLAFDPLIPNQELPQFDKILGKYNVSLNYDKVKENDKDRYLPGDQSNIVVAIESNALFGEIPEGTGIAAQMPNSRSLNLLKAQKEGLEITSLLRTSSKAVGEVIDKSKGRDINGPLDLGVAAEYDMGTKSTRMLAFGNARFLTDKYITENQVNKLLFQIVISWLIQNDDDMLIAPKSLTQQTFMITANQANVTAIILIAVIPIIIFTFGLVVWLRRRHL